MYIHNIFNNCVAFLLLNTNYLIISDLKVVNMLCYISVTIELILWTSKLSVTWSIQRVKKFIKCTECNKACLQP